MVLVMHCNTTDDNILHSNCNTRLYYIWTIIRGILTTTIRFLRRRAVLALIFTCSLTYFLVCLLRQGSSIPDSGVQEIIVERKTPFVWRALQETNELIEEPATCRNSIQGKLLIVDDRGYVCKRTKLLPTGCCDVKANLMGQYSCKTCSARRCCRSYEYCVSCCLHPDKKEILQGILDKVSSNDVLFASVNDHYELCLAKCRTNSNSVHHENSYRDLKEKYCYGEDPPGADVSTATN